MRKKRIKKNFWFDDEEENLLKNLSQVSGKKEVEVIRKLVRVLSNENDIVFDPFMGSGTTGVACKELNRNFVGIDIDDKYFKIAEERIGV